MDQDENSVAGKAEEPLAGDDLVQQAIRTMEAQRAALPNAPVEAAKVVELPVPARVFVASLRGTADEVWSRLMLIDHRMENRPVSQWRELLDSKRNTPAHHGRHDPIAHGMNSQPRRVQNIRVMPRQNTRQNIPVGRGVR